MKLENLFGRNQGLVPISLDQALNTETSTKILPIGGIIFDKGQKFVALGGESDGRVVVQRIDAKIDPSQIVEGSSRILDLSAYSSVQVLQTGLEAVTVHTFPSLRTAPSVGIKFSKIEDRDRNEEIQYRLQEESILELFAGERGRIVVFSGYDLPEDNAFLFERQVGNDLHATLLFVKPFGTDQDIADSVDGVYQLLKQLNQEFSNNAPLQLQTEALHVLDNAIHKGQIDFHGSLVREEIFRTHIIALARLATKLTDRKYEEQLKRELPQLHEDFGEHVRDLLVGEKFDTHIADTIIDRLIGIATPSPLPKPKEHTQQQEQVVLTPKDTQVLTNLLLPKSRDLWIKLAKDRSYRSDNPTSRHYIETIIKRIYEAKTYEEFTDLQTLIVAIFNSDYQYVRASYSLIMSQEEGLIYWDTSYRDRDDVLKMKDRLLSWWTNFKKSSLGY